MTERSGNGPNLDSVREAMEDRDKEVEEADPGTEPSEEEPSEES